MTAGIESDKNIFRLYLGEKTLAQVHQAVLTNWNYHLNN